MSSIPGSVEVSEAPWIFILAFGSLLSWRNGQMVLLSVDLDPHS